MRKSSLGCWLRAAALLSTAGAASAQEHATWADPHADITGDEIVQNGYRRVYGTQVEQTSPEDLAAMIAEGKDFELDPATGGVIHRTFTDYLPKGWLMEPPADGSRVDSFGNPIVNEVQGLPAWSQRNIDALRAELGRARDSLLTLRAAGADTAEAEGVLGNFLGQSIVRDINVDAIVKLEDSGLVDARVAQHVIEYLHFYENERAAKQGVFHYIYTPTQYSPRVAAFVTRHGASLDAVQRVDTNPFNDRGSGCYNTTTSVRGMTILAAPTVIWNADNTDDTFSDVSTGFGIFHFYSCDDADNNDMVRVSSNGFVSFFQQGGNATDGANRFNTTLPSAAEVNGFAGPFWDDLIVSSLSGDQVRYLTEGAVGNRVFTMENYSVSHFGSASTSEFYYFQVKLYEVSDVVEFQYGLWNTGGEESATTGMETFSGLAAHCGDNCGQTNNNSLSNYHFENFHPGNDTCAGAYRVFDGNTIGGNLIGATNDPGSGCTSPYNRDVWYRFLAPCAGNLIVSMCGSYDGGGVDTVVSAHSGCPGTGANLLACNDQFGGIGCSGNDSQITVPMTDGQEVFVRISNYNTTPQWFQNGTFTGTVVFNETGATPLNDNAVNGYSIGNGSSFTDDLGCATPDGSIPIGCPFGDPGAASTNPDIWYTFYAQCEGTLTVDTIGSAALSGLDSVVSVHSAAPGTAANTLACNDQFSGNDSQVSVAMTAGQRVYIRVTYWNQYLGDGRFLLHANFVNSGAVPANDTCAGAITLHCDDSVIGVTCNATPDPLPAGPCGFVPSNGVWYRVVGDGNAFAASTCSPDTTYDTVLHVYSGICGTLTPVVCNDDSVCGVNGLFSRVSWSTTPGTVYYIIVNGFGGSTGQFRLNISNGGRPFNDDCADAFNVGSGSYSGNIWCATPDGTASCRPTVANPSVWYRFVAPADGTLNLNGCGSYNPGGIDMVLSAFAGSCAGPEVACNDDFGGAGCNGLDSSITGPVTAGQVVLIRVTHFGSSIRNGDYVLNINFIGCDSIDWNGDGLFPDTQDIADFINVFGGGFCAPPNPPACNSDIDFNNDGLFPDTDDIAAFIRVFAGGPCS